MYSIDGAPVNDTDDPLDIGFLHIHQSVDDPVAADAANNSCSYLVVGSVRLLRVANVP